MSAKTSSCTSQSSHQKAMRSGALRVEGGGTEASCRVISSVVQPPSTAPFRQSAIASYQPSLASGTSPSLTIANG